LIMTCRDIYESALALLGESPSGENSGDYTERAPYLIAVLCGLLAETDRRFRDEHGRPAQGALSDLKLELSEIFPLCNEFAPAAALYLASMLIFDSDGDRSDALFEKYSEICKGIADGFSCKCEKIVNKYPL